MNTLNLEAFVDSSSEPYLREVRENIVWGWGLNRDENPFSSAFVSLSAAHKPVYFTNYMKDNRRN